MKSAVGTKEEVAKEMIVQTAQLSARGLQRNSSRAKLLEKQELGPKLDPALISSESFSGLSGDSVSGYESSELTLNEKVTSCN